MAELENQEQNAEEVTAVETTEESVVEAAEKQPHEDAEKGDTKPVKQGSSDAESVESGRGVVVKPEENPVDKAVSAAKKAADESKPAKDAVNKDAPAPEKGEKLKETEDNEDEDAIVEKAPSKMESIKAIVNTMKEMTKEQLQKTFGTMSEDEVDESLTKAEVARKIVETLKGMDEEDVLKFAESFNSKEEEEEVKESVDEETPATVEADLVEIEVEDDLKAISEALELSDENAEKAQTIFKAAINSKVVAIKEELEAAQAEEIKTSVDKVKDELAENVDKYLTYCAEEWTKENELAIERGLRSEMTENFIEGLKALFVEHYVEVPEDKYDVIDELANRLDDMEQKLDGEVQKNMDVTEELDQIKRSNVIREACEDLSESQKEKMESLADGVDYKDGTDFAEKVSEVKAAYFGKQEGDDIAEETKVEEGTGTFEDEASSPVLDPTIAKYSEAISKLKPL